MNTIVEKVHKFAVENGYDDILGYGDWKGYEIFEPISWIEEPNKKEPNYILVKDNIIRMANNKECHKIFNMVNKYSIILNNIPIEIEPNVTVKSFKFTCRDYPYSFESIEYKSTKNGKILSYDIEYSEGFEQKDITVPISKVITDSKFDENVLGMIKYFNKDFDSGENPYIMDGEWFEFNAKLSNGNILKAKGHNNLPFNFYKFVGYMYYLLDI